MSVKHEDDLTNARAVLPHWLCLSFVVLAVAVSISLWVVVSEKPMLESQWFMFAWPLVFTGLVVVFALLNALVNVRRDRWVFPSISMRILAWAVAACAVATLSLLVTGGSVHQIGDMDLGRTPVGLLTFMLFLLAFLGAVMGACFTLMYLQPISVVLLALAGARRYSEVRGRLSLPSSMIAVVSRSLLVMLVPIFAVSVTFTLGPWKSDRYGFVAQSSEGIIRWLFSGDFSPISLVSWVSLAAIIVLGIISRRAFSQSDK